MKHPSLLQMYEQCKAHYYTDAEHKWEPFEDYSDEQIEEFISADMISLARFMGISFTHTDYMKMRAENSTA